MIVAAAVALSTRTPRSSPPFTWNCRQDVSQHPSDVGYREFLYACAHLVGREGRICKGFVLIVVIPVPRLIFVVAPPVRTEHRLCLLLHRGAFDTVTMKWRSLDFMLGDEELFPLCIL